MATDLPTEANDPRWLPSRIVVVLLGLGIQLLFVVVSWSLIAGTPDDEAPLVRDLLIPEDVVYSDTDVAPQAGKQRPPVDVRQIAIATDGQLEKGSMLFAEHCSSCHGESGRGDGTAGLALQPKPRDLTSLSDWQKGTRLSDLYRTLSLGLEGTQMPAFDYLTIEERFALSHHAAGLAPDRPLDTDASLDELDAEFQLSAGTREPNVVPLSTALDRLISEAPSTATSDDQREEELFAAAPQGAALFSLVVQPSRQDRVSQLLRADPSWRKDPGRLRTMAVEGTPANGFDPGVTAFSDADWSALNRYLTLRFEAK